MSTDGPVYFFGRLDGDRARWGGTASSELFLAVSMAIESVGNVPQFAYIVFYFKLNADGSAVGPARKNVVSRPRTNL